MKKLFTIITLIFAFVSASLATILYPKAPKADLLDIRFNVDGTATDVSGKNRKIVSSQPRPSVALNDKYNLNAATFTGSGKDFYFFDYSADKKFIEEISGDFTMECLMRIDNFSKANTPFCSTDASGFGFDIGWFSRNNLSFLIHDGSKYVAVIDKSMAEGKYYHAVGVVRPNKAISFYVNGELIGTTPFTTLRLPSGKSQKLYVGCDVNGNGDPEYAFKGEVVVARMYSKALTNEEVKSVYKAISSGNNSSSNNSSGNSGGSTTTTTSTASTSTSVTNAPANLTAYRGKVGQRFTFLVKAKKDGKIWGGKNNIYTDDSDLATASCHSGTQVAGNVDKVVVEIVADQGSYPSLTQNGITSNKYGAWKGAYKIIGVPTTEVTDPDMSKYRSKKNEMVKIRVTGRTTGTIYGKNTGNGYSDNSDLATAAVHAGFLKPGQTGTLFVRIKGPEDSHEAVLSNDVQSRKYGKSGGTFKIFRSRDTTPVNNPPSGNNGSSNNTSGNSGGSATTTTSGTSTSTTSVPSAPANLTSYRDKIGKRFTFLVKAKKDGKIWGGKNNIYTDDSDLATASCHSGTQVAGNVDKVVVEIVADQGSYPSLTQNGITSNKYGAWKGAYKIIGVPTTEVTDPDMSKYRSKKNEMVKIRVTGRTTGTIYGKNTGNGYSDNSDLATAAVHAGFLKPGQTGTLFVRIKGPEDSHEAVLSNNVQSRKYGKSGGTFKIFRSRDTTPVNSSPSVNNGSSNNNSGNNSLGNTSTTTSSSYLIPDGYYVIRYAEKPDYVLTVTNRNLGKNVVVNKWDNNNSQIWRVLNRENGTISIMTREDYYNYYLDIANNKLSNNSKAVLSQNIRLWVPERQSNGTIVLMVKENKNFCLDLMNGSTNAKNNGVVEIWHTHKGVQEQWTFERIDTKKPVVPEGIYAIKSPMSTTPLALTVKDGKLAEGSELVTDNWKNSNSQKWMVTHEKNGAMVLRSMMNTNMVISIKDEKSNQILMKKWTGNDLQCWKPELYRYDKTHKVNTYKLMYLKNWYWGLRVFGIQPKTNNKVELNHALGGTECEWILERLGNLPSGNNDNSGKDSSDNTPTSTSSSNLIPEGDYVIKSAGNTDYVMTLKDGKATNRNQIIISKWQNTNAQKWKVTHEKNGTIVIRSMVNDKYAVNVNEHQMNDHGQIISWLYEKAQNEQWVPEKQSNGNYILKVLENKNYVLDVEGATYSNNVKVQLYGLNGGANQQWVFQKVNSSSDITSTSSVPNAPNHMLSYRGQNGKVYTFKVTGSTNGRIWGGDNNIYTDDSIIATAAVHAGLVKAGQTGTIKVKILPGQSSYSSIKRNGVTSYKNNGYGGSYQLSK